MSTVNQAETLRLQPLGGPERQPLHLAGKDTVVIGRSSDCDLNLTHPHISRHHAQLALRNDLWLLTDLGSRAGTFLNGSRLNRDAPAIAMPGDLVRLGPFTFRLERSGGPGGSLPPADVTFAPGMMVTRATQQELDALAARRLELLMDGASVLYRATNEQELSSAIADLALAGTGFHRAVVLRHAAVEPEVLCSREPAMRPAAGGFSRSMVKEAASGHAVRLSRGDVPPSQHSICTLGIHSALCCPILLDGSVVGYIYLDSRGTEQPCYPDAVGFGHAVARLAGLCLANLKRGDLQIRQKQLENELRAAREVQTFLGPPAESRIGHVRYVARTHPGRFVAGDLFDIFPLDGDRVAVCFGDVCGQGMGAAILMAAILSHLRAAIAMGGDLVAAVGNINRYLVDHQSLETFATLFVAVLDQRLGVLQYVDAGHGHWMVKRADGSLTETPLPGSIVIGVERDFPYRQASLPVAAGDRLVIYSDGVVEQVTPDGEEFGRSRLLQIVATSPDSAADVALSFEALKTFLGSAGLEDDTTLVSITLES